MLAQNYPWPWTTRLRVKGAGLIYDWPAYTLEFRKSQLTT